MNNWIKQHSEWFTIPSYSGTTESVQAIPVSALEELFSKDGEQLAREMCIKIYDICFEGRVIKDYTEDDFHTHWEEAFLEAYNIQEVKMQALKKERDAYYDELHAKRIEVEELKFQLILVGPQNK